jgi:hypothetical protein
MTESTLQHPGIYINAIIAIWGAIWVLVTALIIYIWKGSMTRISKLEQKDETTIIGLIKNPVLTISSHSLLCNVTWKRLEEKLDSMEKEIKLEIKNAILEAARNGK